MVIVRGSYYAITPNNLYIKRCLEENIAYKKTPNNFFYRSDLNKDFLSVRNKRLNWGMLIKIYFLMSTKKKVLILGSTGRLGGLIKNKYENIHNIDVIGVSSRLLNDFYHCESTIYSELREFLILQDPDLIINCAAMTNVDKCETEIEKAYEINQKIPENIYEIVIKHHLKCKVVQISTDQVYKSKVLQI